MTRTAIRLDSEALTRDPHLPAFWPGPAGAEGGSAARALPAGLAAPDGAPGAVVHYAPGPWRPPRIGGREPPVALVVGGDPDPVGAALAGPAAPAAGDVARHAMQRLREARLGGPPGLPDPGAAALRAAPGGFVLLLGTAPAPARPAGPVLRAPDPFLAPPGTAGLVDPWTLLDAAREVHGASRDLALLALAAGVPVVDGPLAGADPVATFARLVAATRCADPFRRRPCTLEEALDILALWRAREAEARRIAVCLRMQSWKRERLRDLLASAAPPPVFRQRAGAALREARRRGGAVLAWSSAVPDGLREQARRAGVELLFLEDGFIRSAGLGAQFRPGGSFALDTRGAYYDPRQPSDLEHLLNTAAFTPELLARAAALRAAVVARGITKYNLRGAPPDIAAPPGRRRVLVPGQVEDDASVRLGGGAIRSNLDLLRRVRAAEPDAFLVYKPHPDIEAGFRRGRIPATVLAGLADQVLAGAPMDAVLGRVDAVHTLTSLTGFEALLRGVPVTCWGSPFYAGWGLTSDRVKLPRRGRRLTVDELVAGALILYPRCVDPVTELPCPPELLLERMDRPELFPPGRRARLRALEGLVRRGVARLRGLR